MEMEMEMEMKMDEYRVEKGGSERDRETASDKRDVCAQELIEKALMKKKQGKLSGAGMRYCILTFMQICT